MDRIERLVRVKALDGLTLHLEFDDGTEGDVCLADRLNGPMLAPLRDPAYFAQVRLASHGAPEWPNGVDLAPDSLYARVVAAKAAAH